VLQQREQLFPREKLLPLLQQSVSPVVRAWSSPAAVVTVMIVSVPCDAILADYCRYGRHRRHLSLRQLCLLRLPARDLDHVVKHFCLEARDQRLAIALSSARKDYSEVPVGGFHVGLVRHHESKDERTGSYIIRSRAFHPHSLERAWELALVELNKQRPEEEGDVHATVSGQRRRQPRLPEGCDLHVRASSGWWYASPLAAFKDIRRDLEEGVRVEARHEIFRLLGQAASPHGKN